MLIVRDNQGRKLPQTRAISKGHGHGSDLGP